ncbi:MAG TPA: nuclear transport factor 2 family protein [Gammaproteobacteria bacterium]|nr:nuclear transport factor 2 family protein [Gammaproteobacteria bacterium]
MIDRCLQRWYVLAESGGPAGLDDLLSDEAVFQSPIVYTPQVGKAVTRAYLAAAMAVLNNDAFRYVREVKGDRQAVLEFETELDGTYVNGVDIIDCDDRGRITGFKVMIRPLQAIDLVHRLMRQRLESDRARP